jgi:transposase
MEEQDEKSLEPSPKAHLISLMQAGHPGPKAAAMAGLHISRSTVYRLLQAVQTRGDAAILDGRHGHPAKLREAVLQWLVTTCRANPQMSSREVQAALQEQFGIHVSIGHLNRVRAQLGIGNHVGRLKKNSKRSVLHRKPSGKRVLVDSCLLPLRKKRACCQR